MPLLSEPAYTDNVGNCYLLALTSFALTAGLTFGSMGLIVLPAEVLVMWPETQAASLGLLLAMTGITQLIAPAVGYLSDRCTHSLGRRRPFMLGGAAVTVTGLVGMRVARDVLLPKTYAACLFVSMVGMNSAYAGFTGLLPDMVPESSMGKASGLMAVLNAVGAALSFYILGFAGLGVQHAYTMYAATVVATVGVTTLVAREVPLVKAAPTVTGEVVRSFYVSRASHGDFFWVFWIRCAYYMGVSVLSFMMLFLRDAVLPLSGDNPPFSAGVEPSRRPMYYTSMIAILGQLGAVCIAVPIGRLSDRHGRKPYIYLSCGMMVFVYLAFLFTPPLAWILTIGFVYGMGNGSFLTVDYALAVDTLPDKKAAAKDLGLWGVSAFIGSSGGPVILGPLLHVVGTLSIGGSWADVLGEPGPDATGVSTAVEASSPDQVRYGVLGYQAILVAGMIFVSVAAYLLKFVSKS